MFFIFILWGLILCILLSPSNNSVLNTVALSIFAFSLSWVVGFITPGAPAGLGIREATLILFLQSSVNPSVSISAVDLSGKRDIIISKPWSIPM